MLIILIALGFAALYVLGPILPKVRCECGEERRPWMSRRHVRPTWMLFWAVVYLGYACVFALISPVWLALIAAGSALLSLREWEVHRQEREPDAAR